jgi:hypothetical protein
VRRGRLPSLGTTANQQVQTNNFWQMILGGLAAKELLGARRLYGRDAEMR